MVRLTTVAPVQGLIYDNVDFTQRWIVNDNWTYTADISPFTQNFTNDTRALLVFYGIDTIANIVRPHIGALWRQLTAFTRLWLEILSLG